MNPLQQYTRGVTCFFRDCSFPGHLLPGYFLRWRGLAAIALIVLLAGATGGHAQQAKSPPASAKPIPTFESLPHSPMPHGEFQQWCGLNDVALVRGELLEAFADGVKLSTLLVARNVGAQCSNDGRRMAVIDDKAGWITEVDVRSAAVTRKIATFEQDKLTKISFSPDLKSVAFERPLALAPGMEDLQRIQTDGLVSDIRWHPDSSEFFVISHSQSIPRALLVEVYNVKEKIGGGPIPKAYFYKEGWFANSHAVYLYLGLERDEFGVGVIWECQIENWKCRQIAGNVLEVSASDDGALGIVRPVGKYSNTGEVEKYPSGYTAEIRNGSGQIVARQQFKFLAQEREGIKLTMSPSGKKAILTWHIYRDPECTPGQYKTPCMDGMFVDLSGVRK